MSLFDYVKCPYCNKEVNCNDIEFDGHDEIDFECDSCKKEFQITREWYTTYETSKINYETCKCGKEEKKYDMILNNWEYVCRDCYFKESMSMGE